MFIEAVAQYFDGASERTHGARTRTLADAFEQVANRFPDDDEAQIFTALYLKVTHDPGEQTFASALKAAAIPARYAIERGAWKEAAQLQPQPTRFAFITAFTHYARAMCAARSADAAAAERDVQKLARIVDILKAARNAYWATEVEVQHLGASAWVASPPRSGFAQIMLPV